MLPNQVLSKYYGFSNVKVSILDGYANINYKVELGDGSKFVLKQHKSDQRIKDLFKSESEILKTLIIKYPGQFPEPVPALNGDYFVELENGDKTIYRLLKWMEGGFYYNVEHSRRLFDSLGKFLAEMDRELIGLRSPAVESRNIEWDLQNLLTLKNRLYLIDDPHIRKMVHYFLIQFQDEVLPMIPALRKSIIHNDANDWNLIVNDGIVSGIIDFGDIVYAPLIQELAVCLAYAISGKDDPLKWTTFILNSYKDIIPLSATEVDLLYYLIAGRLCMSLLNSAYSRSLDPDNEYLDVSQEQVILLLEKWFEINPEKAKKEFRNACKIEYKEPESVKVSLKRRFKHISSAQSVSYQNPIHMNRAAFQYMYDVYGNTFLDAYNNIPHVGHSHPKVVEAGRLQMAKLNTNTRYLYDQLADYSEKLLSRFPGKLNKVFFVNSGSAASDLAIRMAQTHTGYRNLMVMEHGYHGHTRLGIDISHYKFGSKGGFGQADYILKTPIPDIYRGEFNQNDGSAGFNYAKQAANLLDVSETPIAAFIAEPIVGCAGQVPLAKDYLKNVYPMVRKQGGLCISDEVQTGFGRLGEHFWGFELQEVIPDIVILGKPMGNGHPIAAVVTTNEVADSFDNGMEFFSSFGGNPVSCAIGLAVLNIIEEEGLQNNALETGNYFLSLLNQLKTNYSQIGDVRGHGLFLGLEFVKNQSAKEYDTELAGKVKNYLRENFVLVSTDGPMDNIIKMKPPLCFTKKNSEQVVDMIDKFLKTV